MNLRNKNGSITIFVLVGLLFMSAFLVISYASNVNRSKIAKEQFNIISEIYSKGNDEESYTDAYTDLRKKNKQILTYNSEEEKLTSVSQVELDKTFDGNFSNYRIYGNSVQDITNENPSPSNPSKIQSVGNITKNLFNKDNFIELINGNSGISFEKKDGRNCVKLIKTSYSDISLFNFDSSKSYTISFYGYLDGDGTAMGAGFGVKMENNTIKYALVKKSSPQIWDKVTLVIEGGKYLYITYGQATPSYIDLDTIQIEEGTTATEYEPYGKYKIPVKVTNEKGESSTTNIYLDEQLRKVGDTADYIDFKSKRIIRKIGNIESYNGEKIITEYISTTGNLDIGSTVCYKLETEQYENIDSPELRTFEDYTKIEVLTDIAPSKIEVEYTGYTIK